MQNNWPEHFHCKVTSSSANTTGWTLKLFTSNASEDTKSSGGIPRQLSHQFSYRAGVWFAATEEEQQIKEEVKQLRFLVR